MIWNWNMKKKKTCWLKRHMWSAKKDRACSILFEKSRNRRDEDEVRRRPRGFSKLTRWGWNRQKGEEKEGRGEKSERNIDFLPVVKWPIGGVPAPCCSVCRNWGGVRWNGTFSRCCFWCTRRTGFARSWTPVQADSANKIRTNKNERNRLINILILQKIKI